MVERISFGVRGDGYGLGLNVQFFIFSDEFTIEVREIKKDGEMPYLLTRTIKFIDWDDSVKLKLSEELKDLLEKKIRAFRKDALCFVIASYINVYFNIKDFVRNVLRTVDLL